MKVLIGKDVKWLYRLVKCISANYETLQPKPLLVLIILNPVIVIVFQVVPFLLEKTPKYQ